MRILIAPDKFKGSLTAGDAAAAIRAGFDSVFSGAEFDLVPVADGGEGTAEIFRQALGGEHVEIASHDALGREITASYSLIPGEIAVIDMSSASGLWRISDDQRDPLRSSTFGTGELVADAIARGRKISSLAWEEAQRTMEAPVWPRRWAGNFSTKKVNPSLRDRRNFFGSAEL